MTSYRPEYRRPHPELLAVGLDDISKGLNNNRICGDVDEDPFLLVSRWGPAAKIGRPQR